jgi:biotin-(acetyl-CoA carboxylase) ligase
MYINYLHFSEIDSSHAYAMAHLSELATDEWTAISAGTQRSGKGQGEKVWQDVPGKALLLTLVSPSLRLAAEAVFPRHRAAAVAALKVLQPHTPHPIQLKWPNDLHLQGKKLGGLLTEGQWAGDQCKRVVCSLGVNVLEAPEEFAYVGQEVDLELLQEDMVQAIVGAWTQDSAGQEGAYLDHWMHGGQEEWQDAQGTFWARAVDVDAFGRIGLQRTGKKSVEWYLHGQVKWLGKN